MQTSIIHGLGLNQNYLTFTEILLMKIDLFSKFLRTKCVDDKIFDTRSALSRGASGRIDLNPRSPERVSAKPRQQTEGES